jgi:3-phosphoshikimate 1-carboxyvinyltransferase
MEHVFSRPHAPLVGEVSVPGDKSLSHRSVLFAAMAEGTSHLKGVLNSEDVRSTIEAVRALGSTVEEELRADGALDLTVTGWGDRGPGTPSQPIDCGNSGTTARLLLGVLSGWDVRVTLTGDESLSRRPMDRVIGPLQQMGASFESACGTLPVTVHGGTLSPIAYETPVASAQVKSAVLLAGVRAAGRTLVKEPAASRDHTERLLPAFGVEVGREPTTREAWVQGPVIPHSASVRVPGDPSSAAFIVAAGLLVPGSKLTVRGVGLNPTRVAFLDVLERMGADATISPEPDAGAEPVGSIHVAHTPVLNATVVTHDQVPSLVDEVPVLALVATLAHGTTRFEGVGELRVKESDRLSAVIEALTALGGSARAEGDDLLVTGPSVLGGGVLDSRADHRLAMVWALAGLAASAPVTVTGFEAVNVSYPRFSADLAGLSAPS